MSYSRFLVSIDTSTTPSNPQLLRVLLQLRNERYFPYRDPFSQIPIRPS